MTILRDLDRLGLIIAPVSPPNDLAWVLRCRRECRGKGVGGVGAGPGSDMDLGRSVYVVWEWELGLLSLPFQDASKKLARETVCKDVFGASSPSW